MSEKKTHNLQYHLLTILRNVYRNILRTVYCNILRTVCRTILRTVYSIYYNTTMYTQQFLAISRTASCLISTKLSI